jgi:large subunit ribosomal protein L11
MPDKVEVMVDGGKATPGPPLGPALGPLGVNIVKVVADINEKTKAFAGMKVPVKIIIEKDKTWKITVGTPPTSALIMAELKVEKATGASRDTKTGNLKFEQVVKIAKMKDKDLLGDTLKFKVKEVLGSCVSMGVTVDGMDAHDLQREVSKGNFDAKIK